MGYNPYSLSKMTILSGTYISILKLQPLKNMSLIQQINFNVKGIWNFSSAIIIQVIPITIGEKLTFNLYSSLKKKTLCINLYRLEYENRSIKIL